MLRSAVRAAATKRRYAQARLTASLFDPLGIPSQRRGVQWVCGLPPAAATADRSIDLAAEKPLQGRTATR